MKAPAQYLAFSSREEWRAWLAGHHDTGPEAWVVHYKKNVARQALTYEEAVEEALCYGWIDGLLHGVDDEKYALRYSPRRPRSNWSESNQRRVEKLIQESRMAEAGLARVAEARASGAWEAASARDACIVPEALVAELEKVGALAAFQAWPASRQKQYLHWLSSARRPETRQKRRRAIVEMVRSGD